MWLYCSANAHVNTWTYICYTGKRTNEKNIIIDDGHFENLSQSWF